MLKDINNDIELIAMMVKGISPKNSFFDHVYEEVSDKYPKASKTSIKLTNISGIL